MVLATVASIPCCVFGSRLVVAVVAFDEDLVCCCREKINQKLRQSRNLRILPVLMLRWRRSAQIFSPRLATSSSFSLLLSVVNRCR
jgi:hypothetical protein